MIMCGILVGIAYADKAEDAVSLVDKAVVCLCSRQYDCH